MSNTAQSPTQGVLNEAFTLYKEHWQHLASIAFVVYIIIGLASLVLGSLLGFLGALVATVLSIIGVFWLQAALVRAVEDISDGRADLSIQETFDGVKPFIAPVAGAGILAGLGIGIGFVLLIAPGLYLLTIWCVIIPVIVLEQTGVTGAFSRSRELVKGNGWAVLGLIVLTYLILFIASAIIAVVTAPFGATIGAFLSELISGTVIGPFVALVLVILYYRLRGLQTGAAGGTSARQAGIGGPGGGQAAGPGASDAGDVGPGHAGPGQAGPESGGQGGPGSTRPDQPGPESGGRGGPGSTRPDQPGPESGGRGGPGSTRPDQPRPESGSDPGGPDRQF